MRPSFTQVGYWPLTEEAQEPDSSVTLSAKIDKMREAVTGDAAVAAEGFEHAMLASVIAHLRIPTVSR